MYKKFVVGMRELLQIMCWVMSFAAIICMNLKTMILQLQKNVWFIKIMFQEK